MDRFAALLGWMSTAGLAGASGTQEYHSFLPLSIYIIVAFYKQFLIMRTIVGKEQTIPTGVFSIQLKKILFHRSRITDNKSFQNTHFFYWMNDSALEFY